MLQRVGIPALTVVTVLASTVVGLARPAAGDAISDAKAKAAAIESQLTQAQDEMSALSQQYDAGPVPTVADQLEHLDDQGQHRHRPAAGGERQGHARPRRPWPTTSPTARRRRRTRSSAATSRPSVPTTEYNKIAEGDISLAVDNLHTAENSLNAQVTQLQGEQSQAQTEVTARAERRGAERAGRAGAEERAGPGAGPDRAARPAAAAGGGRRRRQGSRCAAGRRRAGRRRAPRLPRPGTTATATAAAASAAGHRRSAAGLSQAAPPPTAAGGAGAVQAAESQEGVPYVWGGESPKGSASPGFDCSGLTAWSWGQVGVGLPHYSGAQMADSTPVPISDLQPGDLLFYGPGGSAARRHVRRARHDDRGALHRGVGLGHLPAPRWRLRGRRPALAAARPAPHRRRPRIHRAVSRS